MKVGAIAASLLSRRAAIDHSHGRQGLLPKPASEREGRGPNVPSDMSNVKRPMSNVE
jgi:hypothetical protein